jgi:hypothetical protein
VSFWKYEVWRSTTPMVSNISDYVRPAGAIPPQGVRIRLETMQSTGQWVDGASPYPLAPNTYYYRLYVFNRNGKTAEGDVVEAIVEPTTLRAVRR